MSNVNSARYSLEKLRLHERFELNKKGRDWFIGDIHGYKEKLINSLHEVGFDFSCDRLFAVGDLVDRGPDSFGVIRLFSDSSWAFSVMGNHEWILIREMEGDLRMAELARDPVCGGDWRDSFDSTDLSEIAELFCRKFPIAISVDTAFGNIGVIHACPPADWSVLGADPVADFVLDNWTDWLWTRQGIRDLAAGKPVNCNSIDAVICGHSTTSKPVCNGNVLFADTHISWSGSGEFTLLTAEALFEKITALNSQPEIPKWFNSKA